MSTPAPTKNEIMARMKRTGESFTRAKYAIIQGKPEPAPKPKPPPEAKPAANQHQQAIRERQGRTGESYSEARRNYLIERGLPLETATSRVTARRRRKREAAVREEYGDALGVDLGLDLATTDPPQLGEPKVQYRSGGRVRG